MEKLKTKVRRALKYSTYFSVLHICTTESKSFAREKSLSFVYTVLSVRSLFSQSNLRSKKNRDSNSKVFYFYERAVKERTLCCGNWHQLIFKSTYLIL